MSRAAGNNNKGSVCANAFKIARNAGGRTWRELNILGTEDIPLSHWLDPVTDLWIPNGMVPLHQKARKQRDRLDP